MSRRNITDLCGVLLIDKPAELTSHDVVTTVRRASGEGRVGHAGTLDPMATGLLVVLIGPATRLAPYLTSAAKSYDARIVFGTATDTDDSDGHPSATCPVPASLTDPRIAEEHLCALRGEHEQLPPAYSAVKKDGVAAYSVARRGGIPDLCPRTVTVFDARLLAVDAGPPVCWDVAFSVSKGTYVRALARDIGRALGTCAHLGALRRTASGTLSLVDAITLDALPTGPGAISKLFVDPVDALALPVLEADAVTATHVAVGRTLATHAVGAVTSPDGPCVVVHEGRVLGIYEKAGEHMRPSAVMPPGAVLETER